MKKLLLGFSVLCMLIWVGANAADTQLLEQLSGHTLDAKQLKFSQVESCESLEKMLEKYAKETQEPLYRTFGLKKELAVESAAPMAQWIAAEAAMTNSISSSHSDFSQTNIQKIWVDEPELLKTDGTYFFYYNEKTQKVSIVASPLDSKTSTLDGTRIQLVNEIAVPKELNDIELFVTKGRLILMGQLSDYADTAYTSFLSYQSRTVVAIYDISDIKNLKLLKFENLPGSYQDARLIDDQLYVISELRFNRWNWKGKSHDFRKGLASVEIDEQGTKVQPVECSQISYVLPEDKNLSLDPVFTLIAGIDIRNTSKKVSTTALLAPNGEIHMSKNALYLVSNFYTYNNWSCPSGLFCVMPVFRSTTQTMIHKFSRDGLDLKYQNTAIVPGSLLTQYSMDEDNDGNFRILTKVWEKRLSTQLYVFKPNLTLAGKLENIEPGEEFKASRYIGDKLYLVTFEQIDPLFVVDLANISQPKIIWELKIPGYSTYLHPLKKEWSKQYLLGLGYNTTQNERSGTVNSGVKLSLFQVDYAKKQGDMIEVKELDSLNQGGKNSDSQVLSNPRLFVMDKKGNVTLPLHLVERARQGEKCNITYDLQGKEQKKDCTPIVEPSEYFVGLKTFSVSPEKWIKEQFAKDYLKDILAKKWITTTGNSKQIQKEIWNNEEIFSLQDMRVGYAWDALYSFSNLFADFIFPNKKNYSIWFK